MGQQSQKIFSSSAKMACATFLSRILGLVREQVMAATFGASGVTDAFAVAYRIPNLLRDLFAEGSFSSAFVPIFTEERLKSERRAKELFWSLFIVLGALTALIALGMILGADPLVRIFTDEKFRADPRRTEITVQLVQIMAPFLTLVSLAALVMGSLNSLKIFFIPALSPATFNICMILSMVVLVPFFREKGITGIYALGFGVVAGGCLQLFLQLPFLLKRGYVFKKPREFFSPQVFRIFRRVGIGVIGIAATQINVLVITILATSTVVGAVSWLNYSFRLFQFPVGLLSVSIAQSNIVHFSDAWRAGEKDQAKEVLHSSYLLSFFLTLPAMALMLALSEQTVHLVFERGLFKAHDTYMTNLALQAYLLGLPAYGLYKILGPTFFSLDKPRIPVFISVGCIAFNIVFCLLLTPVYGFALLAFGTSLSMLFNAGIQCVFVSRMLNLKFRFFLNLKILKFFFSALVCFGVSFFLAEQQYVNADTLWFRAGTFFLCCAGGLVAYCVSLILLCEKEYLLHFLPRRIRQKF